MRNELPEEYRKILEYQFSKNTYRFSFSGFVYYRAKIKESYQRFETNKDTYIVIWDCYDKNGNITRNDQYRLISIPEIERIKKSISKEYEKNGGVHPFLVPFV